MTGIDSSINNNIIDTPEERYLKYKETAEKYKIIQLGIVTWHSNSDNTFTATPYTIYLFPTHDSYDSSEQDDRILNREISSMLFNRNQGSIDFNKWIYKGVSYLNDKQYKMIYKNIIDDNINLYDPDDESMYRNVIPSNQLDRQKCLDIIKDLNENFLNNKALKDYLIEKIPKYMLYFMVNHLPKGVKKELYFSILTLKRGKKVYLLTKVNDEERKKMFKEDTEKQLHYLTTTQKGAKNIYDALINKKSILVGHNISLDILFLISHFGVDLPKSYIEFKELIRNSFTELFDTKIIYEHFQKVSCMQLAQETNSVLDKMYPLLRSLYDKDVKITLNISHNSNISYHNGVYDAYITACVFTHLDKAYKSEFEMNFKNKIFIMKSLYQCFNIDNKSSTEELFIPKGEIYCLRANKGKKTSDIDITQVIGYELYNKTNHKVFSAEMYNAIIVMIEFDSSIIKKEDFETMLNQGKKTFTWYSYGEFRKVTRHNK